MQAKKSLGQHFLHSKRAIGDMISAANIKADDNILEIGPGTGVLTGTLLQASANVLAIEADIRAVEILKEKFSEEIKNNRLNIVHGDILEMDRGTLFATGSYSIVANIPYYITGAILQKFLENEDRPKQMTLMIQREVADRIIANDGRESLLSISVKAYGSPRIVSRVPRGAFVPPPNVDSAIIAIENISDSKFKENNIGERQFFDIVKNGFAHKRKVLISNLTPLCGKEKLIAIFHGLSIPEKVRAEELGNDIWFELAKECQTEP